MAPWTGKLIQSNLDKLTAHNIDDVAAKLVNLLETRTQVQKLALLVSQRVQRAYTSTFHLPFDEKRRHIADSLVASILRCFANLRRPIKGVPTKEGLSGIPLFKTDLLGAALYERTGIAAVATSLYNSMAMASEEIRAILFDCLDRKHSNDADKVGEAILLLEYAARELDQGDKESMDSIMEVVKERLDIVSVFASERKTCGKRLIPSLYDRYWDLVDRRTEGWRQSPYAGSDIPSTLTATANANDDDQLLKATPSGLAEIAPSPLILESTEQPPWASTFAPVAEARDFDQRSERIPSPIAKETQQSINSDSAQVAYGQAIGHPDHARRISASSSNPGTLTFDDDDDSLTLLLDVQAGSPVKVKFDADTRLGDAKKIAKLLAASISSPQGEQTVDSVLSTATTSTSTPSIQFLPNGRVGQTLKSSIASDIFVQYPHSLTLMQVRQIGDNLASAVESYTR